MPDNIDKSTLFTYMQDFTQIMNNYPQVTTLLQITAAFLFFALAHLIKNRIVNLAIKNEHERQNLWGEAVFSAMNSPLGILIWLLFTIYALRDLASIFPKEELLTNINIYLKSIGIITILSWFIIRLINRLEKNYFKQQNTDGTLDLASSYLISKIARAIIFIITTIIILQNLGYSLTALLTLGGTSSLIIGFAGKDMISNFFGGLMVYLDKPFKVGDTIKTETYHLEGTIEKIGWRSTRIRNLEKRPVYVPNNLWVNAPVENISRMSRGKFKEIIGIRYQDADKLKAILSDIEQELHNNKDIDQKLNIIVRFTEYGDYALKFMVSGFSKVTAQKDFMLIKEDILLMILSVVQKHGAQFAIPVEYIENRAKQH